MGLLIGKLASQIAVSVIANKALKCAGKIDYADIIKLGGWCIAGGTLVEIFNYIIENSVVIGFFKWLF